MTYLRCELEKEQCSGLDIKLRYRGPCQDGGKNIMYKLDIKLRYRGPCQDGGKNIIYKLDI